jgi:type II secretory pathway pseudopilin PulG
MPFSIVAAVAIPNLLQSRIHANETAAIATLRNFYSAQAQFQLVAIRDADGDGNGEYGTLAEMMGRVEVPGVGKLEPPLLASTRATFEGGRYSRNGYHFRVYLPDAKGRPVAELASGGRDTKVDAENAEIAFAIYAWPMDAGNTGLAAFMIDNEGEIYRVAPGSRERPYSGLDDAPTGDAAYAPNDSMLRGPNPQYGPRAGRDGVVWEPIGY